MSLKFRKILAASGTLFFVLVAAALYFGMAYRHSHVPLRFAALPQSFAGVGQAASSLVFSRDGKTLIVTDAQAGLSQWSVPDLHLGYRTQERMADGVSTSSLSLNGSVLTVVDSDAVRRWAVDRTKFTALPVEGYLFKYASSTKNQRGNYQDSFPLHVISPSGKVLAGVNTAGRVTITSASAGRQLFVDCTLPFGDKDYPTQVCDIAFSPDDRLMAISSFRGGVSVASAPLDITLHDVHTEKIICRWQWRNAGIMNIINGSNENTGNLGTTGLVFSSNGLYLAAADSNRVAVWESRTGKLHQMLTPVGNSWISRKRLLFFHGDTFLTGCGWGDHVPVWNVHSGRLLQMFYANSFTEAVAVSPNGRLLATGGQDTGIFTSRATGRQVSRDDKLLIAGEQVQTVNGSIALWDIHRLTH